MNPIPSTSSAAAPGPDSVNALPTWLLIALLALVTAIVVAMFALTLYNLTAPRSTLKTVLGLRRRSKGAKSLQELASGGAVGIATTDSAVQQKLVDTLGLSARVGKRTTRTTLAIAGFSLLGVALVASFGLSGPGVRDLRTQLVAAVTTLVAAIAGFFFGAQSPGNPPVDIPPPDTPKPDSPSAPSQMTPPPSTGHSERVPAANKG